MVQDEKQNQLKKELVKMLEEIDIFCRHNNIKYFIAGGTMLGAVRHGGFIPWDDDIDIVMLRSDYENFIIKSSKLLDKGLFFKCRTTDKEYYLPFGKICKIGTLYVTDLDQNQKNEIFIDVFPLDKAEHPNSKKLKIQSTLVKALKAVIIRKKGLSLNQTTFSVKFLQFIFLPFSINTLMNWQEKIMKFNNNHSDYNFLVNLGSNYHYRKQTMEKSVYLPEKRIAFEDIEVSCPNQPDIFLRTLYGDNYMEIPPLEKRISHNITELII